MDYKEKTSLYNIYMKSGIEIILFNFREEQKGRDRVDRCRFLKAQVDRFLVDTEVRLMTVIY